MEKLGTFMGIVDYVVILVTLSICVAIGFYFKGKRGKNKTATDYFLGNRKMSILPTALSILATTISALPMISGIGEISTFGAEFGFVTLGYVIGTLVASYLIIPVFRQMEYISIYEYLENRFDRSVRLGFSFFYIFLNVVTASVALYLPSLVLANVSGFPYWLTSAISGVLCTCYCVVGGFKSVVWTDVVQFILMMVSVVVILWRGTITAGGSSYVWKNAVMDGFFANFKFFDFTGKRFTGVTATLYGIYFSLQNYTTSQAVVQRILGVKNIKAAQRSLVFTMILRVVFFSTLVGASAVIYAHFHRCDPLQMPKQTGVHTPDLIVVYYLQVFLSNIPGLAGIFVAGVLSSGLSTLSSYINSFAATTLEDFLKPLCPKQVEKEKRQILMCKVLTAIFGCLILIVSFIIPYMGGAIKALGLINGAVGGPLTGLMVLALFFPRANKKVCLIAILVGASFCLWLAFASSMYKMKYQTLPLSTDGCASNASQSLELFSDISNDTLWTESENLNRTRKYFENQKYVFPLYKLSFVMYGPLGLVLTVVVGFLTSFIFGQENAVDSRFLSPLVTKLQKKQTPVLILVPCQESEEMVKCADDYQGSNDSHDFERRKN